MNGPTPTRPGYSALLAVLAVLAGVAVTLVFSLFQWIIELRGQPPVVGVNWEYSASAGGVVMVLLLAAIFFRS
jgi:hypothetical protein